MLNSRPTHLFHIQSFISGGGSGTNPSGSDPSTGGLQLILSFRQERICGSNSVSTLRRAETSNYSLLNASRARLDACTVYNPESRISTLNIEIPWRVPSASMLTPLLFPLSTKLSTD